MTSNYSPVWKYMFKVPSWTPRRSCETLIRSNAVLINFTVLENFAVCSGVSIVDFEHLFFLPEAFILGIASTFRFWCYIKLLLFLKSLENQGIFKGNRSCWLIPLKIRLILKAKSGTSALLYYCAPKVIYFCRPKKQLRTEKNK